MSVLLRPLRALYRRLPSNRRVKGLGKLKGRPLLLLRTLTAPVLRFDVKLTDSRGVRFLVSSDPVDARVVDDLTGKRRSMWFPDEPISPSLVLDIGAHHGHYASAAAQRYPDATIIAVEPARTGVDLVRRHAELNELQNRIEIVPSAIGDASATATLHHDPKGSWGSSLFELDTTVTETVDVQPLHKVLDGRRPDVIKCNAEGGEFSLIPQILELGLQPQLMVLMVHPEFGDAAAALQALRDAGFVLESVGSSRRPAYHVWPPSRPRA